MATGLNVNVKISGLENLKNKIELLKQLANLENDNAFNLFIQDKCMKTLTSVIDERLIGGTTNDEYIELYKSSNHIVPNKNGFVIYNDAKVFVEGANGDNYPENQFSIALAFEYGTGIVGDGTYTEDKFTAWEYNKNKYNFGWYYKKDNQSFHTYGYQGFEIYRNTVIKIEENLNDWVKEYLKKKEV